jgi:hypothetical protein
MSIQRTKIRCWKCQTVTSYLLTELTLHFEVKEMDTEEGPLLEARFLCWRCCKEQKWFTKGICNHCSERVMCKNLFETNLKKALGRTYGI